MRLFAIDDALDSDAWYTPPWVFEGLGVTFDLDVAAPADPLPWVPARQRYTVGDESRQCGACGDLYKPVRHAQRWCSRACRNASRQRRQNTSPDRKDAAA